MNNCLTIFISLLPALPGLRRKGCITVATFACFASVPILAQAEVVGSNHNVISIGVARFPSTAGLDPMAKLLFENVGKSADDARVEPIQLAALDGAECWDDGLCQINGCQIPDSDCGDPPPLPPRVISLSISRFTTSTLGNATADAILAEATDILQNDNGGVGDVACDVTFTRNGSVTTFSTGDGSIDTAAEFNTVIGLSGYVKLVNQINYCDGIVFNAAGCAPMPGSSQVVVRWGNNRQEGITWAHEYGHTQGLPHRIGNYVMNDRVTASSSRVNSTECDAYAY